MSDVYALVRSIRQKAVSRNRQFDALATPVGAQARRLHRFLRGIERDARLASALSVRRAGSRWSIALEVRSVSLTRRVTLSDQEFALLIEDDELRRLLTLSGV